jgi:hypothetical protein
LQWTSNHYSVGGAVAAAASGDCNNALRQSSGAAFQVTKQDFFIPVGKESGSRQWISGAVDEQVKPGLIIC